MINHSGKERKTKEQSKGMTYVEAINYINEINKYGSVLGLDNIRELLRRLGNPQDQLKFVHVAGTNGKGSVSSYISTILAMSGYLVGRYISPTIMEYRERIQLMNQQISIYISKEEVAKYIGRIQAVIVRMQEEGLPHPTPFEVETAMAFLFYVDKQCDVVILEVGLGGRLDSTNIINTTVCAVVTSISMDHMQILGDTLNQIAYEKAGIIKEHIAVVSYEQEEEVMEVIEEECRRKEAKLTHVELNELHNIRHNYDEITFDYKEKKDVKITLLGEHQVKNAALAIETAKVLIHLGYSINDNALRKGLLCTKWSGRFDMVHKEPYFFVDGAHNEDAAKSLKKSIEIYFTNKRIIYIMGVLADKDYCSILDHTAGLADTIITITPDNPRALSSKELAIAASSYCNKVMDGENIGQAISLALKLAGKEDVILAFGSLSYLGDIYRYFDSCPNNHIHYNDRMIHGRDSL